MAQGGSIGCLHRRLISLRQPARHNQKLLDETLFVSDSSRLDQDANSGPKKGQARCASRAAALSTWPLKLPLTADEKNLYWWKYYINNNALFVQ